MYMCVCIHIYIYIYVYIYIYRDMYIHTTYREAYAPSLCLQESPATEYTVHLADIGLRYAKILSSAW